MGIILNNEQIMATYQGESWYHSRMDQVFEISGPAGSGKAQPLDTIIPTPKGNKKLGDLKIGDYVFNRHGKPVRVLQIYDQGLKHAFRVTLSDGRSTICNDEHLWSYYRDDYYLITKSLREIMNYGLYDKYGNPKIKIPINKLVDYAEQPFHDEYEVGKSIELKNLWKRFTGTPQEKLNRIPVNYIYSSKNQRWNLLRGILYGCLRMKLNIESQLLEIKSVSYFFLLDVQLIFSSLGFSSFISKKGKYISTLCLRIPDVYMKDIQKYEDKGYPYSYTIIDILQQQKVKEISYEKVYIKEIEDLNYETEMRCIYVDSIEHLYLTNDYIVTHNTTLILYLIERLGLDLDDVLFVAYMGKAACRMALNGLPAKTIHSAIYDYRKEFLRDENGKFVYNEFGKPKKVGKFVLKDRIGKGIKLIVLDEGSMVNEEIASDLLSFGIPVVVLGDLNQLPPVFGNSFFLKEPDVILTQIMRQNEGNPIVYLSQQILAGRKLEVGVYGKSEVIPRNQIKEFHFTKADIVLTETNRLRWNINNYFREELRNYKQLDYPHIGEKVICRKNNWSRSVDNGIYLTNGMSGFVDDVFKQTYNKKSMVMDFRPDFTTSVFKNVKFNYPYMYAIPTSALEESDEKTISGGLEDMYNDRFEYGYAITTHLSQGSQYPKVLFLNENMMRTKEDRMKLAYTAVTRAVESITVVI